ncbi:MAG: hypothetical protein H6737_30260 [Alphaproteobacteria bacterium]|nr:hypothetical protein [Alphaproteobacteria bacterium]
MIALLLAACSFGPAPEPRPEGVPAGVAFLRYSGNDLMLDDEAIAPWTQLREEPDLPFEPLEKALEHRLAKEAGTWVALPGNSTWGEARRALQAVFQAGATPVWLGALGTKKAFGPLDNAPGGRAVPSCPEGPVPVVGVGRRMTIELHADDKQTWADASVRFKPLVGGSGQPVLAELMDRRCWAETTCAALEVPDEVAACEEGAASPDPVTDRVEVAGEHGCVVPFAKAHDHGSWPGELGKSLGRLGIGAETSTMVMGDETVEYEAVLAMLEGLADEGIAKPQLGLLRMGSGDTADPCDAPIRDEKALKLAAARWFGYQLAHGGPE